MAIVEDDWTATALNNVDNDNQIVFTCKIENIQTTSALISGINKRNKNIFIQK
jgi:hypothetical protein